MEADLHKIIASLITAAENFPEEARPVLDGIAKAAAKRFAKMNYLVVAQAGQGDGVVVAG